MKTITLTLAAALLAMPACKEKSPTAQESAAVTDPEIRAAEAPDWTYPGIRARVEKLPDAFGDLMLRHEHIPNFIAPQSGKLHINKDGVTGMRSMTMPFAPADGVDISTLTVGDIIEFDLAVWGAESDHGIGFELAGFTKLPAETELDFTNKPSVDIPADDGP